MIIKALDPFQSEDKFLKAGRTAEEKMAFYLRVDFEDDKETHVLNSVRIELDDGAVQMDHIVLHPWGMIIVESKSVTGKIQIRDDGQWIRWFNDKSSGMESPLTQATIQAKRLRKKLNRTAKPEGFFDQVPIDVLVAVSDQGIILQPRSGPVAGVWKADQIVEKIQLKLATLKKQNSPILTNAHIETIGKYLVSVHKPLSSAEDVTENTPAVIPQSLTVAEPAPTPSNAGIPSSHSCKHCSGTKLQALGGKFSYYFRCLDCGKNTPIQSRCPTCGHAEKIHKRGQIFPVNATTVNPLAPFIQMTQLAALPPHNFTVSSPAVTLANN